MIAPILQAEAVTHAFGSLVVTDAVTLELAPGERHGLIGPNGAGKTTLFNIIAGEIIPDAGTVHLAGEDVTRLTPDRRARLGLARSFQRNNLFADLTVRENLAIACAIAHRVSHVAWRAFGRHREVHESAETRAVELGLEDVLDTVTRHLSYGTQRQLEIALALALEPQVLLLDEPTAGMSPEETAAIQAMIAALPASLDPARHRARHGGAIRPRGPHHGARLRQGADPGDAAGRSRLRRGQKPLPGDAMSTPEAAETAGATPAEEASAVNSSSLLALDAVDAYYDQSHVLQSVSMQVDSGAVVALLGRNGAGKSTTLKTVMGIVPVRAGRTRFDGADITGLSTHRVARLGIAYVPEDRGVFASLTVQEHLTLANVRGGWPLARIYEAFPRLAERRDHRGTQLSGGEQQMLSIARALTLAPRLLLLDEPTEGLAPVIVEEIAAIAARLKAQGLTMLLVEQNYPFAARIADCVYVLGKGRIRWKGTPVALDGDEMVKHTWLGI